MLNIHWGDIISSDEEKAECPEQQIIQEHIYHLETTGSKEGQKREQPSKQDYS